MYRMQQTQQNKTGGGGRVNEYAKHKRGQKNVVMQFKNRTMKQKKKRSAELLFNYSQKKMASIQIWGFLHAYARRLESHKASGVLQGGPRPLAQKPQTQRRFYCYYSGRYLYST